MQLDVNDAAAFLRLTERQVGKRLALVMFGVVLVAPLVQQPIEGGRLLLNGLPRELADRVESSLSRD